MAITFLDTLFTIREGELIIDLPTNQNHYLPTSSADINKRHKTSGTYKNMPIKREYPESMVDSALGKAKIIPRSTDLKKVVGHKQTRRDIFVTFYDPRQPNLQQIQYAGKYKRLPC